MLKKYKKLVFSTVVINQNKCRCCGEYFMTSKYEKDKVFCDSVCEINYSTKPISINDKEEIERELVGIEYRSELVEKKWQKKVPAETKRLIFERDNYNCCYCGNHCFDSFITDPRYLTVDHIVPRKLGGSNDADNLTACCMECNTLKGAKSFNSFEEAREYILKKKKDSSFYL